MRGLRDPAIAPDLFELLACPRCGGSVAAAEGLSCARCELAFPVRDGIPELRCDLDARTATVREFYSVAPFPAYAPRDSYPALRARAARNEFATRLDEAIPPDATVLDIGCGTGQMSLFLATGDRLVVGADLTGAALRVASAAAHRFGVRGVRFVETDLRAPGLRAGGFDVVYCSGVLHHTPDPRASCRAIARLVKPGGYVVVGVYNAYARLPHRLRRCCARWTNFRWIPLDPVLAARVSEPERREAWLRDQYSHPEEHRHTLSEVQSWFEDAGLDYVRTYPSTIIGDAGGGGSLFAPAADNWAVENLIQQLRWCWTLGREGGLFAVVGRAAPSAAAGRGAPTAGLTRQEEPCRT